MLTTPKKVFKTVTNGGDKSKTYAQIVKGDNEKEWSLFLQRYVLTEDFATFELLGQKCVKQYKEKRLYFTTFGIKISTLKSIIYWISTLAD